MQGIIVSKVNDKERSPKAAREKKMVMKPEGKRVWACASCHRSTKKRKQGLGYNCAFINIRGQQSKKVVGKNPNTHFTLTFQKQVHIGEMWEFGRGEFLVGAQTLFLLGIKGGGAERGVLQLLSKLAPFVPVLSLHLH